MKYMSAWEDAAKRSKVYIWEKDIAQGLCFRSKEKKRKTNTERKTERVQKLSIGKVQQQQQKSMVKVKESWKSLFLIYEEKIAL